MNRSLALMVMTLGISAGCGSSPSEMSSSSNEFPPSGNALGASVDKDQTLTGDIDMPATTTIAPGVTLTLEAGAKIHAGKDAVLVVRGTLAADGASGTPVVLQSKAHGGAGEWGGIKVESGGDATLNHVEIHDAGLAFAADAGSSYAIDSILVDTSSQLASLSADGTIKHGQFHGLGDLQGGSPFTVNNASPQVIDTVIDKGSVGGVDLIIVEGAASAPVFDHVEVADAHCVFHLSSGKQVTITNSIIHDSSYGMMITGAVGTLVRGNNFEKNGTNIGVCISGDVSSEGNYFGGGEAFDSSCEKQSNTGAVSAPLSGVGPRE
jgi:parallel beta-helix repeat protein